MCAYVYYLPISIIKSTYIYYVLNVRDTNQFILFHTPVLGRIQVNTKSTYVLCDHTYFSSFPHFPYPMWHIKRDSLKEQHEWYPLIIRVISNTIAVIFRSIELTKVWFVSIGKRTRHPTISVHNFLYVCIFLRCICYALYWISFVFKINKYLSLYNIFIIIKIICNGKMKNI